MKRSIAKWAIFSAAMLVFTAWGLALAEHPTEHPAEHPEHPEAQATKLTVDELSDAIEIYLADDSDLKGGYFMVYDGVNKEVLALELVKIHKDRLSNTGGDVYFVCADLKATNGKIYDLDIFMHGETADALTIDSITVHKESGVARYTWFEKDGTWHMKPV